MKVAQGAGLGVPIFLSDKEVNDEVRRLYLGLWG